MVKHVLLGFAAAAILASFATAASAAPLGVGCYSGYNVKHAGPTPGSRNLSSRGVAMKANDVAVHDLGRFPYGTHIQIPELYGKQTFTVADFADDSDDKLVVVWHAKLSEAVGFTPGTGVCVVK